MALFRIHEKRLLKKYGLMSAEEVDQEYDFVNENRGTENQDVDEITFFCYLKERIQSVIHKRPPFDVSSYFNVLYFLKCILGPNSVRFSRPICGRRK